MAHIAIPLPYPGHAFAPARLARPKSLFKVFSPRAGPLG